MAVEHTLLMALENKNDSNDFIPNHKFDLFVRLDEGRDRPVWESLSTKGRLIPFSPEFIIEGGDVLLSHMLEDKESFIDLSELESIDNIHSTLEQKLKNYVVHLYPLYDSGMAHIRGSSMALNKLGIKFKIYETL